MKFLSASQFRGINQMSIWAKILIVICLALFLLRRYKSFHKTEGFINDKLQILEGNDIYDPFYSSI